MTASRSLKKQGIGVVAAFPLLIVLLVFFAVPVLYLVRRSFEGTDGEFSLDSYSSFLSTPAYQAILFRTFYVSIACTVLCAMFAYPYAYLMTITSARIRRILFVLVLLPFWTSLMVRTYAWLVLLQDNGPIKAMMSVIGLGGIELAGTTIGVLIGMAQILLPFMVLPLFNNLQRIDRTHMLAAQALGATPNRAFRRVYFPQSLPGLFAGSLLVFMLALGFYITPLILGSPKNSMMSQLIVQQISGRLDWASGGAMATVLAVLTLVCVAIASRFVNVQQAFGGSGQADEN